jgi:predicted GIY-YIG superfamily endonuclease
MYYVYLLKSGSFPRQLYVGSTSNLKQRIKKYNDGRSLHTAKFGPWILVAYLAFRAQKDSNHIREISEVGFQTGIYKPTLPLTEVKPVSK